MLKIIPSSRFKKDVRSLVHSGKDISKLTYVVNLIAAQQPLPDKYHDHALKGDKKGFRECHIENNWLLLYQIKKDILVLSLVRSGTHAELLNL